MCLEVAVEAVRILADARNVEVRRGRGGGVYSTKPGAGRALHVAELPDAAAGELLAASALIMDHLGDARQAPVPAAQSRCQKALENYW